MHPIRVAEADLVGRKFIRLRQARPSEIATYFEGVKILQPFLHSNEVDDLVTGFFLSRWERGGIRFSYFTDDADGSSRGLDEHFSELGLLRYLDDEIPFPATFREYTPEGTTNLAFRRFLHLMTGVCLDLLECDVLYAQRLAAKYRLEIGPLGGSSRLYFSKGFEPAPAYRALEVGLREELLQGLDTWHSPWEDWAHFLMVMLLPGDWIYACADAFNPRRPLNKRIRDQLAGGLLPDGWGP